MSLRFARNTLTFRIVGTISPRLEHFSTWHPDRKPVSQLRLAGKSFVSHLLCRKYLLVVQYCTESLQDPLTNSHTGNICRRWSEQGQTCFPATSATFATERGSSTLSKTSRLDLCVLARRRPWAFPPRVKIRSSGVTLSQDHWTSTFSARRPFVSDADPRMILG